MAEKINHPLFGEMEVISTYTTEEAVEDGILVPLGKLGPIPIYITNNCLVQACDGDVYAANVLAEAVIDELRKPDPEDSESMKLRVINENNDHPTIWGIMDGQGITIMLPEDY